MPLAFLLNLVTDGVEQSPINRMMGLCFYSSWVGRWLSALQGPDSQAFNEVPLQMYFPLQGWRHCPGEAQQQRSPALTVLVYLGQGGNPLSEETK